MPINYCRLSLFALTLTGLASCTDDKKNAGIDNVADSTRLEKFEPADGKVLLFVGQELEAIGGTPGYNDGYYDHFPAAGGFTQYTSFSRPNGLAGLTSMADWGDGPENMAITVAAAGLKNSCLAIGLDISNGNDSITAAGGHDSLVYRLGNWLKDLGNRPVFLRIGYEFDGFEWNHYKQEFYVAAWKRIRDKLDSMQVVNVAYVWQSKGAGATREIMDAFYPGDEYVDWVAYSFFTAAEEHHPMIQFAKDHGKPLFLAEASPVFLDSAGVCKPLDLSRQADAEWAWRDWFTPWFRTVASHPGVIKAIHYINSPWKTRPLWKENNYFKNIDARITKNDSLKKWWLQETMQEKYIKASDTLFACLWNKRTVDEANR